LCSNQNTHVIWDGGSIGVICTHIEGLCTIEQKIISLKCLLDYFMDYNQCLCDTWHIELILLLKLSFGNPTMVLRWSEFERQHLWMWARSAYNQDFKRLFNCLGAFKNWSWFFCILITTFFKWKGSSFWIEEKLSNHVFSILYKDRGGLVLVASISYQLFLLSYTLCWNHPNAIQECYITSLNTIFGRKNHYFVWPSLEVVMIL
jgi:hypothetical protein